MSLLSEMESEQKATIATILTDEVCLAGELNDDEVQKLLINAGCFSLVNIVQDIK